MLLKRTLKKLFITVCFCLLGCISLSAQVSFGSPIIINSDWKFILADEEQAAHLSFDDKSWQRVDLPHDWSVKQPLSIHNASCMGYLPGGIGWYRKTIGIPADKIGEKVYIYFEGVYNYSEVYVNGQWVGERPNGYVSFMYDITPHIEYGKENVIAVRVDHSQSADSRWYTGSGIYRNVWLVYADPIHISQWGVYVHPQVKDKKNASLNIEVDIENGTNHNSVLTVLNELISPEGKVVGKSSKKITVLAGDTAKHMAVLNVANPQLWSIDSPVLYTLNTSVVKDGKTIDKTTTTTGLRSFTFDPDRGFALNGEWMKMKGVCLHHDAGVLGAAVPRSVWERRLKTLKEVGCNAIRTSHNPQATDLYDLCDKLGLLVMNEAFDEWEHPKRKWLEGWNVGTPGFEGNFEFFKTWGETDLADMVRRDRNHVSIFAWSIGNEVDYPNDPYSHPVLDGGEGTGFTQAVYGGYKKDSPDAMHLGDIAKRLVAVVKKYDKFRPTTAGLAGVAMSNMTEYPAALDIAGYNYTESRYDEDHKTYPQRVIYGSENRHDFGAWKSVRDRDFIFGQFLWTGIDYLGESGRWPSRGFYSGLLDFGGFIKPRGYFRQAMWSDKPMVYIGTYPNNNPNEQWASEDAWAIWNYEEGQNIRVVCYTNAAKAQLLLDGKVIGETKPYNGNSGIIYWDIPYKKGRLEAVGMNEAGEEIGRHSINSSKRPDAIKLLSKDATTEVDGSKIVQVAIQIVDEDGVPVMLSDNEITCTVGDAAKLLGLEASNNHDMGDYTDNKQRVFHGRMIAYIKMPDKSRDAAKVVFTSAWLKKLEIDL